MDIQLIKARVSELLKEMRSQQASPSDQLIANFFGVNRSTCQRWRKATGKITDENLRNIPQKLGCSFPIFEQYIVGSVTPSELLTQENSPLWASYLAEHDALNQLLTVLRKTSISNVVKVAEVAIALISKQVTNLESSVTESEFQTIQDLMSKALRYRQWRLERNGLERLAEEASLTSQQIKDIWLGGRPDHNETIKLAAILGKTSDELFAIRDKQYGTNGDTLHHSDIPN